MGSLRQPNKQDWAALRAEHIGCDVKVFSQIVNGRSSIGAELAMRLAGALDTSPEFWLNAQQAVDVHADRHRLKELPQSLVAH